MSVTVKIPTQLRSVTGGESEAQVDEAEVADTEPGNPDDPDDPSDPAG